MESSFIQRRRLVAGLVAAVLVVGACSSGGTTTAPPAASAGASAGPESAAPSSGGGQLGGTVTVIGTWGGSEQESFLAMVAPFEAATGVDVQYTGTRDINTVLSTGVASGILPDVAGLPGPGQLTEWAKSGALKPLDDVLDVATYTAETAPALVALGTVDGKISGVFIKAAVKGLIWFNPANYTGGAPATWDALEATAAAPAKNLWCVGLESGAASGWPGTDWIEDFVLRQSGPDVYDAWVAGTQKWTSPEIKTAFEAFGKVITESYGGSDTVLTTNFGDGGNQLFTSPRAACSTIRRASSPTSSRSRVALRTGNSTSSGCPTSTPPMPGPRPAPATCSGCSTTPPGPRPDGLPRHRRRPEDLGRARRRPVGQQERHRVSR